MRQPKCGRAASMIHASWGCSPRSAKSGPESDTDWCDMHASNVNILPVSGAARTWLGILLSPMVASAAMAASSISVLAKALRLRSPKV